MATTKQKQKQGFKLQMNKQVYQEQAQKYEPKRNLLLNCFRAFWVGGAICLLGQIIQNLYVAFLHLDAEKAAGPTSITLILISVLLTGFGIYDNIGQYAGAGSAVPITGFANSMSSAAIEHRSEGYVLGVAGNMFKLAGSVIVYGVTAAFIFGMLRVLLNMFY
ncbi:MULTISPECIES: stage V sporulation protein AC [Brevibacillus]|uniref:Stage V sporulation protein AC n=1 Tax=Brevibacillus laterosporus TaxID=1465 RepID=A0AAP3DII9_BRELA|nr:MULTISPECIES: stage V sporulation protein AC [Brevibacillus]ATO51103.1 stage V sporulation protein AC [Brevibacillus laterosporus DSM 25]MBG9774147.1 stage V sporulation protein AC [Brevibacillus laterosporus]MBG9788625.1 stage V sporulation protein AC [Brevibacillus laterosporus]MBG9802492.1 stage V sporulation protein AC [Brevibacillus laterosporus]MCG7316856.1 stage V sporulation protein AC [Brevibacillus laterosporus]